MTRKSGFSRYRLPSKQFIFVYMIIENDLLIEKIKSSGITK